MSGWESVDNMPDAHGGNVSDHLELLSLLGAEFASTRDLDATLAMAVEKITRYVEAAGGALFMVDETGRKLRCHACWGATEITGMSLDADQGIVGRCVQNNTARSSATFPRTRASTAASTPRPASPPDRSCARR